MASLLELPSEIRLRIYEFVFLGEKLVPLWTLNYPEGEREYRRDFAAAFTMKNGVPDYVTLQLVCHKMYDDPCLFEAFATSVDLVFFDDLTGTQVDRILSKHQQSLVRHICILGDHADSKVLLSKLKNIFKRLDGIFYRAALTLTPAPIELDLTKDGVKAGFPANQPPESFRDGIIMACFGVDEEDVNRVLNSIKQSGIEVDLCFPCALMTRHDPQNCYLALV